MVAVLFARRDSIYKSMPECDVWDIDRDALNWPGGMPVVSHPPCRAWCRLRRFSKHPAGEEKLAIWAAEQVQRWGGVLEHPYGSLLWDAAELPVPGQIDRFGGWTLSVPQFWWGHRADKLTWLYIVGALPGDLPPIPLVLGEAPCVVKTSKRLGHRPLLNKSEREKTPPNFASWLVDVATICGAAHV